MNSVVNCHAILPSERKILFVSSRWFFAAVQVHHPTYLCMARFHNEFNETLPYYACACDSVFQLPAIAVHSKVAAEHRPRIVGQCQLHRRSLTGKFAFLVIFFSN